MKRYLSKKSSVHLNKDFKKILKYIYDMTLSSDCFPTQFKQAEKK